MGNNEEAIARLEVEFRHLVENGKRRDEVMHDMTEKLDAVLVKLNQAEGGIKVLRWLGLGSLGGAVAAFAALYSWIKGVG